MSEVPLSTRETGTQKVAWAGEWLIQGQNLAVPVLFVPHSLDSGEVQGHLAHKKLPTPLGMP